MFQDQVFCFTPKGELIALPRGATPVDFAYAVHTQVGDTCVGAKINGRMLPLRTQLANGDQVEIITSKAQTPSPTWERFVVTGKARPRIRRFIRTRQREQYIQLGTSLLDKAFREEGYEVTEKGLDGVRANFKQASTDDLVAAVGAGLIGAREVLTAVYPGLKQPRKSGGADVVPISRARNKAAKPATAAAARRRRPDRHPRPDPRHGGAFRRLLPSAAGRPHRRHHHHRQGRHHPHDRLRHARELLRRAGALDRRRLGLGERGRRRHLYRPAQGHGRQPAGQPVEPVDGDRPARGQHLATCASSTARWISSTW